MTRVKRWSARGPGGWGVTVTQHVLRCSYHGGPSMVRSGDVSRIRRLCALAGMRHDTRKAALAAAERIMDDPVGKRNFRCVNVVKETTRCVATVF